MYIHYTIKIIKIMYSLDCSYYDKEFKTIDGLVNACLNSGMDPNYEVTFNGKGIGENLFDFMQA